MKLLFDENLSHKLVDLLATEFPGSIHVRSVDLAGKPDSSVWEYAGQNGFAIVSKDGDFRQRSLMHGAPPKFIWVQTGNTGTAEIAKLLRRHAERLEQFGRESESALIVVRRPR